MPDSISNKFKIENYFDYISLSTFLEESAIDPSTVPRVKKSWVPNWLYNQRFRSDRLYDWLTMPDPFYITVKELKASGDKFYSDLIKIIEEDNE